MRRAPSRIAGFATPSITRRQLLTGGLAATGLAALPWSPAAPYSIYQRGIGTATTYTANDPGILLNFLRGKPGYSPTLASVYQHLLQPGVAPPTTTDPFLAATKLIKKPWFRGLGSADPLGNPPWPQLVRRTQYNWLDTHPSTGFHPVLQPIRRVKLEKAPVIERTMFRNRALLQTRKIYKALLRRPPQQQHWQDELSVGIRSLISRSHVVEYRLSSLRRAGIYVPTAAWAEADAPQPAAPPFGSTVAVGDSFTGTIADHTTTHAAIEALAASAAFAEAAAIMGLSAVALAQAAHAAVGVSTIGVISAAGLSVMLSITAVGLATLAVVVFFAIVSGRPRGDGTYDIFSEMAPFASQASSGLCGGCSDPSGMTSGIVGPVAGFAGDLSLDLSLSPIGNFPSDDAGAAPSDGDGSDGVAGDTGDGGDF